MPTSPFSSMTSATGLSPHSLFSQAPAAACPPLRDLQAEPLWRPVSKTDPQKHAMAKRLSQWMQDRLQQEEASVAVVARAGNRLTKTQDHTHMEHTGLAVYNAKQKAWTIFDLLNNDCSYPQRTDIWRNHPVDFFYSQPYCDEDALLLIPPSETQKRLHQAVTNGHYKKLHMTHDYNLVTPYHTARSLNCNKWVLLNLMAAKLDNYHPPDVVQALQQQTDLYRPTRVNVPPFLRPIAKWHPLVLPDEIPATGPIETVTVESLYRSQFFQKKLFYRDKPRPLFASSFRLPPPQPTQRQFQPVLQSAIFDQSRETLHRYDS